MVFEVPLNVNNKKIRKTKKIRYKYKFFLNKYHQENEVKTWGVDAETGTEVASSTNDNRRISVLTPQPSEFETEHENSESNHGNKKKIDYETTVLSKYPKPEDQYEQWFPSTTSFQKQRQALYPMLKNGSTANASVQCVHASYIEKLKKQACSEMTDSEIQWLSKDIQKNEDSDNKVSHTLSTSSHQKNSMENTYMGKHVYNIIQLWHFAMLDHKWDKAYKCFSILLRVPNVDIRSIWSLGCATLKNHQQAHLLEVEKKDGNLNANSTTQSNTDDIGVFTFNPQFSVSGNYRKKHLNANQLTYMKFLEWMCTVFSSRTHFNQNLNYMMDPVWRKGSYKHTPVYVYTWLWSLLVESSTTNLENFQNQQSRQNRFFQNNNSDVLGDDLVQWIIEKINEMILTPPYMDDPMIKYIQACAHLVKADELVSGSVSTRRRNTATIGQHVQSCKKLLRMISTSQANASIDKRFCFNKRFIEKQLEIIEKQLYIEESEEDSEEETRRTILSSDPPLPPAHEENHDSLHRGLDDLRYSLGNDSLGFETQIQQGDDFADDSMAYDSDVYARLDNNDEDDQEIDNFRNDHHYSSSD
ncbi:hypothetical protein ACO0QE_003451 [Hanseniaspora vineae]